MNRKQLEEKLKETGLMPMPHRWYSAPEGWTNLVDLFVTRALWVQSTYKVEVSISQIKEKFGQLRIYFGCDQGNATDEDFAHASSLLLGFSMALESISTTICQDCSKPGKLTNHGWQRTLCSECSIHRSKAYSEYSGR